MQTWRTLRAILVAAMLVPAVAWANDDNDDDDLTLEELPAAVRSTLEREAKGATIEDIDRERRADGSTYYEVEIEHTDQEWKLQISPTGELLQRKRD